MLRAALEAVAESVRALREREKPAPKRVHGLRVACRRAEAAVVALGPALDEKLTGKIRRRLRRLRRAAGPARDLDISVPLVAALSGEGGSESGRLEGERKAAFGAARRSARRFRLKRFRELIDRLLASGTTGSGPRVEPALEPGWAIRTVLRHAQAAGPGRGSDTRGLHRLRVRLKRLRYTVELFGPTLPAPLPEALLAEVKALLDRLGAMTDAAAVLARVEPGGRSARAAAAEFERAKAAAVAAWQVSRRSDLLARIARAVAPDRQTAETFAPAGTLTPALPRRGVGAKVPAGRADLFRTEIMRSTLADRAGSSVG